MFFYLLLTIYLTYTSYLFKMLIEMKAYKQTMTGAVQGLVLYLKYFQVTQPKSTCFHDTVGENGASKKLSGHCNSFWK